MRESIEVEMDIPPKESIKKFIARWYRYNSCRYSDYAKDIFNGETKGRIFINEYHDGFCEVFGTDHQYRKNSIKYSATFIKNLGEI